VITEGRRKNKIIDRDRECNIKNEIQLNNFIAV
jgi:hypothetical protein